MTRTAEKPIVRVPALTSAMLPALSEAQQTFLESIRAIARDPSVDVSKVREIRDLILAEEARIAEREFNAAMLGAQQSMPRITKDAWNPHTKSRYPRLESISQKVDPIAQAHGFTLSYGMADCPIDAHYRIICDVNHIAGHTKRYYADIGMDTVGPKGGGTKSGAQGSGSSISFGRRYLKVMIFDIAIGGEDTDGILRGDVITEVQARELEHKMSDAGITLEQFCAAYGVQTIADLPAARYQDAINRITAKMAAGSRR